MAHALCVTGALPSAHRSLPLEVRCGSSAETSPVESAAAVSMSAAAAAEACACVMCLSGGAVFQEPGLSPG